MSNITPAILINPITGVISCGEVRARRYDDDWEIGDIEQAMRLARDIEHLVKYLKEQEWREES